MIGEINEKIFDFNLYHLPYFKRLQQKQHERYHQQ